MSDFFTVRPGQSFLTGDDAGIENDTAVEGPTRNLICDRTGFRIPVSVGLKEEWSGAKVRPQSWEARHPLDFIRATTSEGASHSERPEQTDTFVDHGFIECQDGTVMTMQCSYAMELE